MAYIIDIDGTLANMGERRPFDWDNVGQDTPHQIVIDVVRTLFLHGKQGLYVTGRMEQSRLQTQMWLHHHVCHRGGRDMAHCWCHFPLYMRPDGLYDPDQDLKYRIYKNHIEGLYEVEAVFDDRNKVVDMWREKLGLVCFQVAPGDF